MRCLRRVPTAEVTALGTEYGLEATLVPSRGYPIHMIPRVAMPRRLTLEHRDPAHTLVQAVRATLPSSRAPIQMSLSDSVATWRCPPT